MRLSRAIGFVAVALVDVFLMRCGAETFEGAAALRVSGGKRRQWEVGDNGKAKVCVFILTANNSL